MYRMDGKWYSSLCKRSAGALWVGESQLDTKIRKYEFVIFLSDGWIHAGSV